MRKKEKKKNENDNVDNLEYLNIKRVNLKVYILN